MSDSHTAVFFDFGGTLFSYRAVTSSTAPLLKEAARRLQVEARMRDIGRAYGEASREAYSLHGKRPYYLHRDLFCDTYRLFARNLRVEPSEDFVEWLYGAQRDALFGGLRLRDDCVETLQELRARGLYLSIVSNIDDDYLVPMVEQSGLHELLDHWTSSEEAQSCKPDPGFFHLALEKANRRAGEVLFVGDSREHDIQGARNVGMTSVLIVEEGSPMALLGPGTDTEPHHEIQQLSELLDLV